MAAKNEAKRESWMTTLQRAGLDPSYDEEFDGIEVRRDGLTYVIPMEGDDEMFVAVLLPNCWPLRTEEDRTLALRIASDVSCEVKVAKAFLNPDGQNVSMSGEMFLPSMDALPVVLGRLLESVAFARQRFGERMAKARGQGTSSDLLGKLVFGTTSKAPSRPNLGAWRAQGLRQAKPSCSSRASASRGPQVPAP